MAMANFNYLDSSYLNIRGRKTGIGRAPVIRDEDNLENVDKFFESSESERDYSSFHSSSDFTDASVVKENFKNSKNSSFDKSKSFQVQNSKKSSENEDEGDVSGYGTGIDYSIDYDEGEKDTLDPQIISLNETQSDILTTTKKRVLNISDNEEKEQSYTYKKHKTSAEISKVDIEDCETIAPKISKKSKTKSENKSQKKHSIKVSGNDFEIIRSHFKKPVSNIENNPEGRFSGRQKIRPLQFWKNEKVTYFVDQNGVRGIDGIEKPLTPKAKPRTKTQKVEQIDPILVETEDGAKVEKNIICSGDLEYEDEGDFRVATAFKESTFASRYEILSKNTSVEFLMENTQIFYIISGKLNLTIGDQTHCLTKNQSFYIPSNTEILLENNFKFDCKLFSTILRSSSH